MKILIWEHTSLKTLETDLDTCLVENILDAMMKRAPVGFLCILGIQYMTGSVFSFSVF